MEGVEGMEAGKAARHAEVWGRYCAEAGDVREGLLEAVERESADFRLRMESSEAGILELMGHLEEGRVMVLEIEGVEQVWTDVRGKLEERARWISEFMKALTEAERERKAAMDELLYSSLAAMVDVAHLSDGEIQRLVESEALSLNKDVLQNQRVYADLNLRLQSKEVDLEEQKRTEWERGLEGWRLLRTQHTMKTFTETIRGADFVEPRERLGIFAEIRAEQEDCARPESARPDPGTRALCSETVAAAERVARGRHAVDWRGRLFGRLGRRNHAAHRAARGAGGQSEGKCNGHVRRPPGCDPGLQPLASG